MSIRGLGGWVTPPAPAWGLDALPPWPGSTEPFKLEFEFEFEFVFRFGFEYVESTEFRLELDLEFDLEFGLERFFLRSLGFSFG